MKLLRLALVLIAPALVLAQTNSRPTPTPTPAPGRPTTIYDFQVPQYGDDGNMTSMLMGGVATIYPDRMADISRLQIDLFKAGSSNRLLDARVTSPHCYYHADMGVAASDDAIRISRTNMVITGSNYVVNIKAQRIKINRDSKVVIRGMRSTNTVDGAFKR